MEISMTAKSENSYDTRGTLSVGRKQYGYFRLRALESQGLEKVRRFPTSIKILLENMLRNEDGYAITREDIGNLLSYPEVLQGAVPDVPFMPGRVLLQDFTGVPAVVDLATMRDAMQSLGGDPNRINPLVRADLVIDHSLQVDRAGSPDAICRNEEKEYNRNRERFGFLRWAQGAFRNFTVVPPGKGICHQVNLEYLASVVRSETRGSEMVAYPDTLVGTDSHTTMINGLGVLGWGVGGIEAEAVMLGQPYYLRLPEVVGVRLIGRLGPGVTATDLVLHVTQMLRERKVVGKFVEFYGPGVASLSLPDRATIANMAPEYGATMGFFPVDEETINYLRLSARDESLVQLVEVYTKEQGMFGADREEEPLFTEKVVLDLGTIEPSLAGPKRPQDRVPLKQVAAEFRELLGKPLDQWGFGLSEAERGKHTTVSLGSGDFELSHGSVVIASITSCTNTSNPATMVQAGLLAKKALECGIRSKPWVKTSLAPGSRVVTDYLKRSGLMEPLEAQGFHVVGYGCATCIGNSGPLPDPVNRAVQEGRLVSAAVLSGNRNFEGRIHSRVRANYLASPPLVVAYALAGSLTHDLEKDPLGKDREGKPIYLKDIWPFDEEVRRIVDENVKRDFFEEGYRDIFAGDMIWEALPVPKGGIYAWEDGSTYIRRAPYFENFTMEVPPIKDIEGARVLLHLGDSVTTDHISPAGAISPTSPAGEYLQSLGIAPKDFNSYGSRRGNHEVMIRGTFANIRLRNLLLKDVAGGFTRHFPDGEQMTVWDAAMAYRREGTPLIVLAGKEYGTGSSRDWAAKGTLLLGVRVVIAGSYERIHRSNLIGMGVLPLQFLDGQSAASLGLTGEEIYSLRDLAAKIESDRKVTVDVTNKDGTRWSFTALSRLDTPIEVEYYRNGGILLKVLRNLLKE